MVGLFSFNYRLCMWYCYLYRSKIFVTIKTEEL